MREIKFQFVIDGKYLSKSYTIEQITLGTHAAIYFQKVNLKA